MFHVKLSTSGSTPRGRGGVPRGTRAPSEQGPLGGQAVPPGVARPGTAIACSSTWTAAPSADPRRRPQAQLASAVGRPAVGLRGGGRLADDQPSADPQQRGCRTRRWPPAGRSCGPPPRRRVPRSGDRARPPRPGPRPPRPSSAEGRDRRLEEPAALGPGVEQHQVQVGPGHAEHQARARPPPLPEVDDRARRRPSSAAQEPGGVVDVGARPGPGPRNPRRPGALELRRAARGRARTSRGRRSAVDAGAGRQRQSGMMTTRRRASSPSDTVWTPSMSLTVSWTTLRSGGAIGSSAFCAPLATHVLGDLADEAPRAPPGAGPGSRRRRPGCGRGPRRAACAGARCGTAPAPPAGWRPSAR